MSDFDPALSKKGSSQNPSGFSTKEDEHSSSFEGINEIWRNKREEEKQAEEEGNSIQNQNEASDMKKQDLGGQQVEKQGCTFSVRAKRYHSKTINLLKTMEKNIIQKVFFALSEEWEGKRDELAANISYVFEQFYSENEKSMTKLIDRNEEEYSVMKKCFLKVIKKNKMHKKYEAERSIKMREYEEKRKKQKKQKQDYENQIQEYENKFYQELQLSVNFIEELKGMLDQERQSIFLNESLGESVIKSKPPSIIRSPETSSFLKEVDSFIKKMQCSRVDVSNEASGSSWLESESNEVSNSGTSRRQANFDSINLSQEHHLDQYSYLDRTG